MPDLIIAGLIVGCIIGMCVPDVYWYHLARLWQNVENVFTKKEKTND